MSCSPCGYSYSSNPQLLMTGQHPSLHYPSAAPAGSMAPDGPGGLLPYDGRLLSYSRLPELYAATYPDPVAGYMAGHHAVLYPPGLASPYDIKDPRTAWSTLPQAGTYDPILAAYSPYGDRFDPVDSEARRRNATRETTSTLKAWLNEHRKNPYPTKGEKIMLAIITKMTLTQVSTWFANARRRLKKENKMTWEPRNKTGDDLDDVSSDDEEPKEAKSDATDDTENLKTSDSSSRKRRHSSECEAPSSPLDDPDQKRLKSSSSPELTDLPSPVLHKPTTPEKPKIWSLAQTATSDSPPKQFPETSFSSSHHQFLHRNRLDSSADSSSTSSPPLWRTTPLDPCGDHMGSSASPSSTGSSSAVVATTNEQGSSPSGYGRRFDALQRPMDYASYYSSGLAPPSIDMRTFHPHHHHPYLRPSSYYAVGFTCAPPAVYHNHPPVTTISKSKSGEGNASRIES